MGEETHGEETFTGNRKHEEMIIQWELEGSVRESFTGNRGTVGSEDEGSKGYEWGTGNDWEREEAR